MVVAPPPVRPFAAEVGADPGQLRIGVLSSSPAGPLDPECEAAVWRAAHIMESLGHEISHDHPEIDHDEARQFGTRWVVNARLRLQALGRQLGREVTADDVEPLTWAFAGLADHFSSTDAVGAIAAGARCARRMGQFWTDHDLLVTPTLGELPPMVGELTPPADDPLGTQARTGLLVPFTTHFNVTGQPAISLPLHMSPIGLPVGVQLVAAYGREDLLIRVASQLEQAAPWADRRPVL
jgi:amidase